MLTVELSDPRDEEVRRAVPELPRGAWKAVRERGGRGAAVVTAWITYGEPSAALQGDSVQDRPPTRKYARSLGAGHSSRAGSDRLKGKPPVFTLRSPDAPLNAWGVVRTDPTASEGSGAYVVTDSRGSVLGRITRGRSPLKARRAWTIELPDTGTKVTGYRGTWTAWLVFVLLLPLWVLANLFFTVIGFLDGDFSLDWDDWGTPRRTVWRVRSANPFAPAFLARRRHRYRRSDSRLDPRVAYAQMILEKLY